MDRAQKHELVSSVRQTLEKVSLVVVVRQFGLTVSETLDLRRQMRAAGAELQVIKNTLATLAVKDTRDAKLSEYLTGPTALAYSTDPIAAAKVVVKYANSNQKLEIVCGALNGQLLDANAVKALATLPSLDELRAQIMALITTPATQLVRTIKEPSAAVARVVSAYSSKS